MPKLIALLALLLGPITEVRAGGLFDTNLLDPNLLGSFIPQNVADEAIRLVGSYTAHRPYTGAVSIANTNLLDFGIETTLVKLGSGLPDALTANGISSPNLELPALPMAKVHLRKGLGKGSDFGLSALTFKQQSIYGADLNLTVLPAEEGPSLSFRFLFTSIRVPLLYVEHCTVLSPELVLSQPLSFAESWIGIGGRHSFGIMKTTLTTTVGATTVSTDVRKSGAATSGYAFTGVRFRIPGPTGLRLGIEGSFDSAGYHTLGTFIGAGF
jgi:hypothetical protein